MQPANVPAKKPREALLAAAVGFKGSGKTYRTLKMINEYLRSNPLKKSKGRRVLILDINDEFTDVKTIRIADLRTFCQPNHLIQVRRVRIFKDNGQKMTLNEVAAALFEIIAVYRGGLLLIEDINKYVSDSLPNDLIGAICTQRHVDMDVMIHFQSLGRLVPKMWDNINYVRVHKQSSSMVKLGSKKFPDKLEMFCIAESMVEKQYWAGNKYFFVYVEVLEEKIKGAFSKKMFMDAVDDYLTKNYKSIVKPMLDEVDLATGKAKYPDRAVAVNILRDRMYQHYYGNPQ